MPLVAGVLSAEVDDALALVSSTVSTAVELGLRAAPEVAVSAAGVAYVIAGSELSAILLTNEFLHTIHLFLNC